MLDSTSSSTSSNDQARDLSQSILRRCSRNSVVGIIIDSAHVSAVTGIVHHTKNDDALRLISLWRRELGRFPYLVLAGQLKRENSGVIGGHAARWQDALDLYGYCRARLDQLAGHSSFFSLWQLHLSPERCEAVRSITAQTMPVAGTA